MCAWVLVEIAFALHGWPGLGRYMFGRPAVLIAIAGVGIGRLLSDPPRISRIAALGGAIALVAVIVLALVPPALSRARGEHRDIRDQRTRTAQIGKLTGVISRLGGPSRFKPCGEPLTRLEYQTILAWNLHVNVATVGYKYGPAIACEPSDRAVHAAAPGRLAGAGAASAPPRLHVAAALGPATE